MTKSNDSTFYRVIRSFLISLKKGNSVDNLSDVLRIREHIGYLLDRERAPYLSEIDTIENLLKSYEAIGVTTLSRSQILVLIETFSAILPEGGNNLKNTCLDKDDDTIQYLETCIQFVKKRYGSEINATVNDYVVLIYKKCIEAEEDDDKTCSILRWTLYDHLVSILKSKCGWVAGKDGGSGGNFQSQPNKDLVIECLYEVIWSNL